jgi:hypothetical protein
MSKKECDGRFARSFDQKPFAHFSLPSIAVEIDELRVARGGSPVSNRLSALGMTKSAVTYKRH